MGRDRPARASRGVPARRRGGGSASPICFDAEFPALVQAAQVEAGAWLILVPTCTDTLHGFNRVRLAAAARAMENQCFVVMAPTVGEAPWSGALDRNRGFAAAHLVRSIAAFRRTACWRAARFDAAQWVFLPTSIRARLDAVRRRRARSAQPRQLAGCATAVPRPCRRLIGAG